MDLAAVRARIASLLADIDSELRVPPVPPAPANSLSAGAGVYPGPANVWDGPASRFADHAAALGSLPRWTTVMLDRRYDPISGAWNMAASSRALTPAAGRYSRYAEQLGIVVTVPLAIWARTGTAGTYKAVSPSTEALADRDRQTALALSATIRGEHDRQFRTVARALISAPYREIVVRLGHEANGRWPYYSARGQSLDASATPPGYTGASNADLYIAAYRHARSVILVELGGSLPNLRWEWNVMESVWAQQLPGGHAGDAIRESGMGSESYPGDDVVDICGIDLYRRATRAPSRAALADHLAFARSRQKLWGTSEYGFGADTPGAPAETVSDVDAAKFVADLADFCRLEVRDAYAYAILFSPPKGGYDLLGEGRALTRAAWASAFGQ